MADSTPLEESVRLAIDGDRGALDIVVRELQPEIYGLALRMLWNKEDAEDATQEILVRVVTRLSQFDFKSRLRTWAYRVAVNYILDVKKSATERLHLSFERLGEGIEQTVDEAVSDSEQSVLIEEVKVGCTLAMLQCLDRPHRLAYVLGDIMEMSGPEAAHILDISPDLYRKRLQHARSAVIAFTRNFCGLVSDEARCRCSRQVPAAVRDGRVNVHQLTFAGHRSSFEETRAKVRQVDEARWALEVHRTSQPKESSVDFARRLLDSFEGTDQ